MFDDPEYKIIDFLISRKEGFRTNEIKTACKLTEPTLHKYLNRLREKEIIIKKVDTETEYPYPVYYKINNFIEILENIFIIYTKAGKEKEFHKSPYCQENITPELLRYIENGWDIELDEPYPSKAVVEKEREEWRKSGGSKYQNQTVGVHPFVEPEWDNPRLFEFKNRVSYPLNDISYNMASQGLDKNKEGALNEPYPGYGTPEFFTEEDILKIFKLSPTALKKALDRGHKEGMGKPNFQHMLLHSLILDLSTEQYENHKFVTELKIEFNEIGKEDQKFEKQYIVYTRDELGKTT